MQFTRDDLGKLYKHLLSILLTGLVAAGIAFLQSIANANGIDCGPQINPENAGVIGSFLRGGVSIAQLTKDTKFI